MGISRDLKFYDFQVLETYTNYWFFINISKLAMNL
jgi:hypothetical protein